MQMFLGSTASFNPEEVSYWACDLTFNEQNRERFPIYIHIIHSLVWICASELTYTQAMLVEFPP